MTGIDTAQLDEIAEFAIETSREAVENDEAGAVLAESRQRIIDRAEEAGLEMLGRGSSRLAFALGDDRVVKFAYVTHLGSGREQNRVEKTIWRAVQGEGVAHRFVPVVEADEENRWLVQPRCDPIEGDDAAHEEAVTAMLREMPYLPDGCEFLLPENLCWCEADGRMGYALLDYGSYVPREFVVQQLGEGYVERIGEANIG